MECRALVVCQILEDMKRFSGLVPGTKNMFSHTHIDSLWHDTHSFLFKECSVKLAFKKLWQFQTSEQYYDNIFSTPHLRGARKARI